MGYVGTYDRTIFYNPGNKYCIISVKTSDQSVPQQARSAYRHRDNMIRFIAVGYELPQTDKVSMILDGEWENGKHGVQLQVDKCEEIVPQTKEGVLSPFRSEGLASVEQLNAAIRELVNPARDEFADLKVGSHYFRVGDKVMQTKNNAKASNGDIGYIRKMGRNAKNEMVVTIEFSGDRIAEYGMEEMGHMELAYATTVHKAMGSEFDIVIMPILRSHYIMLNRNIVYTAITRAKEQVIPVGQKKALIMAILKKATGKRNTQLGERIGKYLKAFTRQNELKKVS